MIRVQLNHYRYLRGVSFVRQAILLSHSHRVEQMASITVAAPPEEGRKSLGSRLQKQAETEAAAA